jgi:hypothetical protein
MLLFAIPNGGARSKTTGARLKKEGVVSGVSDLILMLPSHQYHALCIEMKTDEKNSRQRDSQREWQLAVESQGYKYIICRTYDEFRYEVESYISHAQYMCAD